MQADLKTQMSTCDSVGCLRRNGALFERLSNRLER